jgi:hypothetical protein
MSCPVSTAWSHHFLSLYCTEHVPSHDAVLPDRIITVVMSMSV